MTSSPRRSGRTRKASLRNSSDGWTKETLRLIRESSESSNPTSPDTEVEPLENDNEFALEDPHRDSVDGDADEDNLSVASRSSKSTQVPTPEHENAEDDADLIESDDGRVVTDRRVTRKLATEAHSRGISLVERGKSAKGGVWQSMFGPNVQDLKPMLIAKERWLYLARDVTLPSWTSMHHAMSDEWSGDSHNILTQNEENNRLPLDIAQQQVLQNLSLEEVKNRHYFVDGNDHKIVLGPWERQKSYDLPYTKSINLGQAWYVDENSTDASYHSGWLLNVGEKPHCMAWSPRQAYEQYVAIVTRSTPRQRSAVAKVETDISPAFSPSASSPLSIQIWRFATVTGSATKSTMAFSESPQLFTILGCNFGDIKQMEWAPGEPPKLGDEVDTSLGVLTIVSTDGFAHLVLVPKHDSPSTEPQRFEILNSAIQISPPKGSIFTCFTYASPTDLILGTSTGYIHIYNLSQLPKPNTKLEPYFSLQTHHTYVMSLKTVEEEYSHFLASTSAAGTIQLIDLRSPKQDTLTIPRARIPTRNLVSNLQTRTFITSIDSSGNTEPRGNAQTTIVAHNLRHFYSATILSKFPEGSGTSTALAGSPLHPYILMGNSGGTVWAQNVVRRVLPTGKPNARNDGGAWVQKVVEYEWIPQHPASTSGKGKSNNKVDYHNGPAVRQGISRMHHGFKPERLDLSNAGSKKRKASTGALHGESAVQVIYEEEQAVTCIEWNLNPMAASWCAIGWGSGVVLVQDLGHDVV